MKLKGETINNTGSVNKAVTENDEILETERGNSSPSPNSKQKNKFKHNLRVIKRKWYWLENPW